MSALRCCGFTMPEFGPAVAMVRVTWTAVPPAAPAAIAGAEQVTVASGRPLQANVMGTVVVVVGVTMKVEDIVLCPESSV